MTATPANSVDQTSPTGPSGAGRPGTSGSSPTGGASSALAAAARFSVSWKAPILFGVFTVLALVLFIAAYAHGTARIALTASGSGMTNLPTIPVAAGPVSIVCAVIGALVTGYSFYLIRTGRHTPMWAVSAFAVVLVFGFLAWAAAGHTLPITDLLAGSLTWSVPLVYGALGGVISERVGVVNIAIEGQLLAGAFAAAVTATLLHSLWWGLIAAAAAGMIVSFLLATFAIRFAVDQVIIGVVLNVLVLGLTNFFFQAALANNSAGLNAPGQFTNVAIPGLSLIPVIGPILFNQTIFVYLMYVAVAAVFVGLYKTRWGLRLRAVGEHPKAADTVGIRVGRTRFWNVALAGALVGFGGAYFSTTATNGFTEDVSSNLGYIALAAVIFGNWNPLCATFAALLFGFAEVLQNVLSLIGSPVPNDFMLMVPYVVTIFAVAGLVGKVRGPAASGKPYVSE